MAFKNDQHDDMRLLKNRLWKLMRRKGIKTSRELAKVLLEDDYLRVKKEKEYHNYRELDYDEKNKAIDTQRKKLINT